ncbi:MAG: type II toxin-antitoxin system HicB family antitoxin [Dehalococcoidia bacterium]
MSKQYKVTVFLLPDRDEGVFTAYTPQFPDVITSGRTRTETLAKAKEALELALEDRDPDQIWSLELSHTPDAEIDEVEVGAPAFPAQEQLAG